jgi:thymidylate synthase
MRLYMTPAEALSEIRRDLAKGPKVDFTRVQHKTNMTLPGRELLLYSYAIDDNDWPETPKEMIDLGRQSGFDYYQKAGATLEEWIAKEWMAREAEVIGETNDNLHPALSTTFEGHWPSYTYGERLMGAHAALLLSLEGSPDSRRAVWPIYRPEDAYRASAPTRIPCSLAYQAMIRMTNEGPRLLLIYFQRSADFDTFFWSDVWLAHKFQRSLCFHLADNYEDIQMGQFMHVISSLHSFSVDKSEIY